MTYGPVVSREYGPIQLGLPGPAADDDVQIGDENRLLGALAGGEVRGHLGGGRGLAAVVAEAKQSASLAIVRPSLP